MSDHDLSPFASALAGWLDEHATPPARDLADVLARAEAMSDEPLPASLRDGLDDDDALGGTDVPDPELATFARDLRSVREDHLRERELEAIPPVPQTATRKWMPYALAGLAAAALLVLGVARFSPDVATLRIEEQANAAERSAIGRADGGRAKLREAAAPTERKVVREAPVPEEAIDAPEPEPETAPEPEATDAKGPRVTVEDLEQQAREAWKNGDLARAQRLFRMVVRRSGHSTRAELAYGDLFSVVKQRSGSSEQAKLWREYLRRFPRGRYADDARAGLCRRASEATQAECWADYLQAHPKGAHAQQARRVTGQATP